MDLLCLGVNLLVSLRGLRSSFLRWMLFVCRCYSYVINLRPGSFWSIYWCKCYYRLSILFWVGRIGVIEIGLLENAVNSSFDLRMLGLCFDSNSVYRSIISLESGLILLTLRVIRFSSCLSFWFFNSGCKNEFKAFSSDDYYPEIGMVATSTTLVFSPFSPSVVVSYSVNLLMKFINK